MPEILSCTKATRTVSHLYEPLNTFFGCVPKKTFSRAPRKPPGQLNEGIWAKQSFAPCLWLFVRLNGTALLPAALLPNFLPWASTGVHALRQKALRLAAAKIGLFHPPAQTAAAAPLCLCGVSKARDTRCVAYKIFTSDGVNA